MNNAPRSPDQNAFQGCRVRKKRFVVGSNARSASTSSVIGVSNDGGIGKNFRRIALEAETHQLVKEERYAEALSQIAELQGLQAVGWSRVYTLVLKIECEAFCGQTDISNDLESVTQLLLTLLPTNIDLMDVALRYKKAGKPIRALVLFLAGIELYKRTLYGDAIVRGIKSCVKHVTICFQTLTKHEPSMRSVLKDSIIPVICKTAMDIGEIDGSTRDISMEQKARCLYDSALCYRLVGEDQASKCIYEEALSLMKREFKSRAVKYQVYGRCNSGLGQALKSLGHPDQATERFESALRAFDKATDWTTEEQKQREIAFVKQLMRS